MHNVKKLLRGRRLRCSPVLPGGGTDQTVRLLARHWKEYTAKTPVDVAHRQTIRCGRIVKLIDATLPPRAIERRDIGRFPVYIFPDGAPAAARLIASLPRGGAGEHRNRLPRKSF